LGSNPISRYLIVIVCFVLTAIVIYQKDNTPNSVKNKSITQVAENISNGWEKSDRIDLNNKIIIALDLDEYVNNTFYKNNNQVSLYIGYYYSSKKIAAAHSPLVCYPGQGWNVLNKKKSKETIKNSEINIMSMEITNSGKKELILYWFQVYDKTSTGTFYQKIYSLINMLTQKSSENAFVRVSIPMNRLPREKAYEIGVDFINAFYPGFLTYIQKNN